MKYAQKAKDNYKSKLPIYLFYCYINERESDFDGFINFEVNEKIANKYAGEYFQLGLDESIDGKNINDIASYIDKKMKENEFLYDGNIYLKYFENVLNRADFNELISIQKCSYCGISKEQISLLGNEKKLYNKRSDTRGYNLEIDRKNPNKEYTKDNCCMSCYWCNNAKTDEFNVKEFKEIAKGINRIWNIRLKDINSSERVYFPENSAIWNMS